MVSATIIYHIVKSYKPRVLVCAPSNIAVDNLTLRLHRLGLCVVRLVARSRESVRSEVENVCLHNLAVYVGGPTSELYKLNAKLQENGQLSEKEAALYKSYLTIAEHTILSHAEVVCCTCSAALDARLAGLSFPAVLVDESTQAREPECLIPIVNGCNRLILVGDHKQLGPVIQDQEAKRAEFDISLFERLLSLGIKPYCLNIQYRMHPALSIFPSNMFYNGALKNAVHSSERTRNLAFPWPRSDMPMMFWCVQGSEDPGSSGRSFLNRMEATCVEKVVERFINCGIPGDRIGVITPYDSQRTLLRQVLSRHMEKAEEVKKVEIASVDEFQGRENDYIIFSCVRSNSDGVLGFLNDMRRLNVAITRAKYGIVIIGNPNTLRSHPIWVELMNHFQMNKCLVCGASLDHLSLYSLDLRGRTKYVDNRQSKLSKRLMQNMGTTTAAEYAETNERGVGASASAGVSVGGASKGREKGEEKEDELAGLLDVDLNDTGF